MKTLVGKFVFTAALSVTFAPLDSIAQNLASQPGTVNRSVERVSLLPGPTLLSPARGAPQSTPNITIVPASQVRIGAAGEWRFVPAYRGHGATQLKTSGEGTTTFSRGTLTLGSDAHRTPSVPEAKQIPLNADLFRFDTPLHPPSSPLKLEAVPAAPKRD
jgi:hypothetical protein